MFGYHSYSVQRSLVLVVQLLDQKCNLNKLSFHFFIDKLYFISNLLVDFFSQDFYLIIEIGAYLRNLLGEFLHVFLSLVSVQVKLLHYDLLHGLGKPFPFGLAFDQLSFK